MAKAKVNSGAESDMPVRFSLEVEFLRICMRVQVCGRQHGHDLLTLLQLDTAKPDILPYDARFGELHGRDEPQKFLDGQIGSVPIFFQPIAKARIFQKLIDRTADQMRGGFVPREQQKEEHRNHLVTADVPAFLFNAHKFGDETITAILSNGFYLPFHIALHREDIRDHAQETDGTRKARKTACPSGELWPVRKWQAEKLANHRKRQLSSIAVDQVSWTTTSEQFFG